MLKNLNSSSLKFAVIGFGKMGLLHASLLSVFPNVKLVALCDKSALMNRLSKKVLSRRGVCVVNEVEKLSGLGLDAIYVTTPISSHAPIIRTVFEKQIAANIFVEKTLASKYAMAKELCALAKKLDSVTMVGYMKRFSVVFGKAKALLTQGDLGEPISFKAYAYSSDFLGLTKQSKSSAHRGGALRDIGCHVIDLALWLMGDLQVGEVVSMNESEGGSETAVSFTASNSLGLTGFFDVSQQMANYRMPEFGLTIELPKGRIDVNDDRLILAVNNGNMQRWYRHDLNDNVPFSIGDAEYFRENQQFVSSLLGQRKCQPDFDTAAKVDYVLEQVKIRSGQK